MILVQEVPGGAPLERAREAVNALPLLDAFLVHADLDPSLERDTRAWLAFDRTRGELRGVATSWLGLGRPALAVATLPSFDADVARALLRAVRDALAAGGPEPPWIAVDDVAREPAFRDVFIVRERHEELHYMLPAARALPCLEEVAVETVPATGGAELDQFLRAHGAMAWSPGSFNPFSAGLYVWVREKGEVVAAAGIHFATPVVGQIANVLVKKDARRRGLGRAVTVAVARRLRARELAVSLFVSGDNAGAVALYESLGFKRVRTLAFIELG